MLAANGGGRVPGMMAVADGAIIRRKRLGWTTAMACVVMDDGEGVRDVDDGEGENERRWA
ncbi:MAG: hypothetical protein ACR2P7_05770 [bacterium]